MKKILIVDDDNRNIFALKAVLQSRGYQCLASSSAQEGLSLMERDASIGIALMDMMMPDMDGYEAIANIKSNKELQNIFVVAVTAQAMPGDREKCLAAGADNYISKPVNVDALVRILDEHINGA